MLMINWTPVAVELQPQPGPERPFARRRRLREIDCDAAAPPCLRSDGNGMYDQRVRRGSNFVRAEPEPVADAKSDATRRKWIVARQRLEERQRLAEEARTATGTEAEVQCGNPWPKPRQSHDGTQTDVKPGNTRLLALHQGPAPGRDACAQVIERDLIDFDAEAFPVAEALVAVALEHAVVAALYADDAAAMRRERAVYEAKRLAECVELERLEHVEGLRRERGLRALAKAERADPALTYRALHGRALAAHCADGLFADALARLESADYLSCENLFATWLRDRIRRNRSGRRGNRAAAAAAAPATGVRLDALVGEVIANRPQPPRRHREDAA